MKKIVVPSLMFLCLYSDDLVLDKIHISGAQYKLDDFNRNVYSLDSSMIEDKGFTSVKEVFQTLPFASFSDTGLGQNVDLRGQGASANVNTQVLLNGIGLNMLDSSHGVTPLDSVGVGEIESIEVLPGGGAVMYGSGTRGGVINITTKKRYNRLSANAGIGYSYSNGSNANFEAKLGGKIGNGLYLSAGGNYMFSQGYRDKDLGHLGGVNGNLTWDLNSNHSISIDVGYFKSKQNSTPVLRFSEISSPSRKDRTRAGNGKIITLQDRISLALNYDYKINDSHKIGLKTFFHDYSSKYQENFQVMNFSYMGAVLPNTKVNQDGSQFLDSKIGVQLRYDYTHKNGLLIVGMDSIYNEGKRKLDLKIDWKNPKSSAGGAAGAGGAMAGGMAMGVAARPGNGKFDIASMTKSYDHKMKTDIDAKKWSNSIFVLEKYDFNPAFSLTGGARYEFAWYGGYRSFYNDMKLQFNGNGGGHGGGMQGAGMQGAGMQGQPHAGRAGGFPLSAPYSLHKDISSLAHNFALELTPRYNFKAGNAYAKYERGFRSPNPDNLTSRNGSGSTSSYIDTKIKSETYDTFELGSKLFVGESAMILVAGFYTLTHNEIYTLGSAHTGNGFKVGNYKLTQRAGVELASEQNFLDGVIGLNESFTYIDARVLDSGIKAVSNHSIIPYVSDYKATLGINYRFHKGWNLWITSSFVGAQRDTAQNIIPAYNLTDIGMDFSFKNFSLSFGVRNVANTFYYTYYNKDKSDEVTGYAFLVGEGRSYFVNGRYKF